MKGPIVSVLILTKNGSATLPALLASLGVQHVEFEFEIVAVDSGSTDGTVDLLRQQGARVVEIRPDEFNHGSTRNLGIESCRGEFVVLIVQDAEPTGTRWLSDLIAPLQNDDRVAGTFGRQIPRPDASPVTKEYLSRWIAASPSPRLVHFDTARSLDELTPSEQVWACAFDNVCSAIRRSVWNSHRFPRTAIAEDIQWGRAVLRAGFALQYVPLATVCHSHDRSSWYELKRTYLVHQHLRRLFGLRTVPDVSHLAHAVLGAFRSHTLWMIRDPSRASVFRWMRAMGLAVAFPLGQYLGALSADTGRELLRARGV